MTTFLRLERASRNGLPSPIIVNADNIVSIQPDWPHGAVLLMSDTTSLHVRCSLDALQARLCSTGGRVHVYDVPSPHTYALDHEVDEAYEAMRADLLP
jgi:hypothetical protein